MFSHREAYVASKLHPDTDVICGKQLRPVPFTQTLIAVHRPFNQKTSICAHRVLNPSSASPSCWPVVCESCTQRRRLAGGEPVIVDMPRPKGGGEVFAVVYT